MDSQIHQFTPLGDALTIHDVKDRFLEGRRYLVLDDLGTGTVADDFRSILDGLHPADINTHRGVELQGITARRRFGIAEHDADLLAQLVDEDTRRVGLADGRCQLAQGL